MPIKRAILSVSDKTGIVDIARVLISKNVEILSTGGTAKHLADNGIAVTSIAQWSGAPEILGGRVKTLTPKVFGAIVSIRSGRRKVSAWPIALASVVGATIVTSPISRSAPASASTPADR